MRKNFNINNISKTQSQSITRWKMIQSTTNKIYLETLKNKTKIKTKFQTLSLKNTILWILFKIFKTHLRISLQKCCIKMDFTKNINKIICLEILTKTNMKTKRILYKKIKEMTRTKIKISISSHRIILRISNNLTNKIKAKKILSMNSIIFNNKL